MPKRKVEEPDGLWAVYIDDYDNSPTAICNTKVLAQELAKALGSDTDIGVMPYFREMPEVTDVLLMQTGIDPNDPSWDQSQTWHQRYIGPSREVTSVTGFNGGFRYISGHSSIDRIPIVSVHAKGTDHRKVRREFKKLVAKCRVDAPLLAAQFEAETLKREIGHLRVQIKSLTEAQGKGIAS